MRGADASQLYFCPGPHTVQFNIINMRKADSLFNEGMAPLLYSTANARAGSKGWQRVGSNIKYYEVSVCGWAHCPN